MIDVSSFAHVFHYAVTEVSDNVFLLEECPHDWLFPQCSAVVSFNLCLLVGLFRKEERQIGGVTGVLVLLFFLSLKPRHEFAGASWWSGNHGYGIKIWGNHYLIASSLRYFLIHIY